MLGVCLFATLPLLRAELVVLQPQYRGVSGGSGTVWRFDAATGAKLGTFSHDNEGFGMMTYTPHHELCVTTNILGTYFLYRFSPSGQYLNTLAAGDQAGWTGATRGADGNFYALMTTYGSGTWTTRTRVVRLGSPMSVLVDNGAGGMTLANWMVFGPNGALYVAEPTKGVLRFNGATGAFMDVVVPLGRGGLPDITRMIIGPDGRLYCASRGDNSVRRFDAATGAYLDQVVAPVSGGLVNPRGLAFGPDGNLYVSSYDTNEILRYDGRTGAFLNVAVRHAELIGPTDIVFTREGGADVVWFDDALPAGAQPGATGGDGWNWIQAGQYSGTAAHRTEAAAGLREHYFNWASQTMPIAPGDVLFVYVNLTDPGANSELMLSWHDGSSWEHRAYWGANAIPYGQDGTAGRRYMGTLPRSGGWHRLEIPASLVGLEGRTVSGMAFSHYDIGAVWDRAGRSSIATVVPRDTLAPTVAIMSPANGAMITETTTFSATAMDNASVPRVTFRVDGAIAANSLGPPYSFRWSPTSTSNGSHVITAVATDDAGNSTTSAPITVTVYIPPPPPPTTVWFDDALPAGAWGGATGGDGWNWITANPAPQTGTRAHQTNLSSGLHEHYFNYASNPLTIASGDYLYAWVYIDPSNPPQEMMLSWFDGAGWEHRAYWGANLIPYGTDGTASRFRAGWTLPPAGQWTRLTIPAHWVDLVGKSVVGMAFSLHGGRVTWDSAGRTTDYSDVTPPTVRILLPSGGAVVSGSTTTISVEARDDRGLQYVEVFVDGTRIDGSVYPSSMTSFVWDSTRVTNGSHTITATATDGYYNRTNASVTVTVNNALAGDTTRPTVSITTPAANATVSGWVSIGASASDNVAVASVQFQIDGTPLRTVTGLPGPSYGAEWNSTTSVNGTHLISAVATDASGNQATASTMVSVNNPGASGAVIWVDGAVPAGAFTGATGGDGWNWITANPAPFSARRVHQSNIAAGLHDHYFNGATATLEVFTGETLFAYVYLDPANPPQEIMLSWNDGHWEHRAYWGGNFIMYGTDGTNGRRHMGPLPAAGAWVKLAVPASQVGLEGRRVQGMAFSLYGGRAAWDIAGKSKP